MPVDVACNARAIFSGHKGRDSAGGSGQTEAFLVDSLSANARVRSDQEATRGAFRRMPAWEAERPCCAFRGTGIRRKAGVWHVPGIRLNAEKRKLAAHPSAQVPPPVSRKAERWMRHSPKGGQNGGWKALRAFVAIVGQGGAVENRPKAVTFARIIVSRTARLFCYPKLGAWRVFALRNQNLI